MNIGDRAQHNLMDGQLTSERRFLGYVAETQSFAICHKPAVRLVNASEDLNQCRLAGSVRSDQADALAFRDRKCDVLEEGLRAKRLAHRLGTDQMRHVTTPAM